MFLSNKERKDAIVEWIRDYFEKNGDGCSAVLGLSGGKDSSIVAGLCAEALGADRVVGVLMPNGTQSDIDDAHEVAKCLGIKTVTVNINDAFNDLKSAIENGLEKSISAQAVINMPPRIRMATLYAVAQSLPNGGRVANTCNLSEDHIGYSTKFGDNVGDFAPLASFTVRELKPIGYEITNLPKKFVDKTPSDGLCGKSDEDAFGFTYEQLDDYILNGTSGDEIIDKKIDHLNKLNLHKSKPMPTYSLIF